jgi:acyl-CoA oxidase
MNPENIRRIFLYQSCERARKVGEKLAELTGEGIEPKEAWDYHSGIVLTEAAVAHTYYWIFQNFFRSIYFRTENEKIRKVLFKLLVLYGIEKIISHSHSFFETGVVTTKTYNLLHVARERLLKEIRPEALALVEAFGYDDNTVHSAIGCSDGKPYQRILDWAQNKNVVNQDKARK